MPENNTTIDTWNGKKILEALPYGAIVLNPRGRVIWLNKAAQNILGGNYIDWLWINVIQQQFAPKEDDGHEVSLVNGRRVQVAVSAHEAIPGQLITMVDLTTSREYEQMKAQQQRLALIGQMTAQVAHQIRTPLASATLFMEQLMETVDFGGKAQHYVERIRQCHAGIAQQIKDLLLFSKGESLIREKIPTYQWIEQLHQRLEAELTEPSLKLTFYCNLSYEFLYINAEAVSGAVSNLLHNAIQAGADEIEIYIEEIDSSRWKIRVRDNGEGIEQSILKNIGTPFMSTKAQGSGLGLAVVLAVSKAHSGRLDIETLAGNGTCVTMHLNSTAAS